MSKFLCNCGHVMNLTEGWSKYEFSLIPERQIEVIAEQLDDGLLTNSDQFYELIDKDNITVYRCTECKRIYLKDKLRNFESYIQE